LRWLAQAVQTRSDSIAFQGRVFIAVLCTETDHRGMDALIVPNSSTPP
jgi:hypothetical protein